MDILEVTVEAPSREYVRTITEGYRRAVLLRGALRAWKPRTTWTPRYLKALTGGSIIRACENDDVGSWYEHVEGRAGTKSTSITVSDFLDLLDGDNPKRYYAGELSVQTIPNVRSDLGELAFLPPVPESELVIRFWLGKANLTQLHYDTFHTFMLPIWGTKEVMLYPPSRLDDFYPSMERGLRTTSRVRNPKAYDKTDFPNFAAHAAITVRVTAEDMLFIPIFWWHFISGCTEVNLSATFHFGERAPEIWRSPYFRHYIQGEL